MKKLILPFILAALTAFDASAQLRLTAPIVANTPGAGQPDGTLVQNCDKIVTFTVRNTGTSTITRAMKLLLTNTAESSTLGVLLADVVTLAPNQEKQYYPNVTLMSPGAFGATEGLGGNTGTAPGNYKLILKADNTATLSDIGLGSPTVQSSNCGNCTNPYSLTIVSASCTSGGGEEVHLAPIPQDGELRLPLHPVSQ